MPLHDFWLPPDHGGKLVEVKPTKGDTSKVAFSTGKPIPVIVTSDRRRGLGALRTDFWSTQLNIKPLTSPAFTAISEEIRPSFERPRVKKVTLPST